MRLSLRGLLRGCKALSLRSYTRRQRVVSETFWGLHSEAD